MVHGNDTILPIAQVAKNILNEGEKIIGLDRIQWYEMMTTDLHVWVTDIPQASPEKSVLTGSFTTSMGRTLYFSALPIPFESLRSGKAKIREILAETYSEEDVELELQSSGSTKITLDLHRVPPSIIEAGEKSPEVIVNFFLELINSLANSMMYAENDLIEEAHEICRRTKDAPGIQAVIGGIENFTIPSATTLQAMAKRAGNKRTFERTKGVECVFVFDKGNKRVSRGGNLIVPFNFKIDGLNETTRGFISFAPLFD